MISMPELARRVMLREVLVVFWLVSLAIVFRVLLYWWFVGSEPAFIETLAGSDHSALYREALTSHLGEYLLYNHTEPPLAILRDWALETFAGPENIVAARTAIAAIFDSLAAGLAYLVARRLGAGVLISVLIGLLVSHRFMLLELSTSGGGWDALNPFFATLYLWLLLRLVQEPAIRRALLVGLAGFLLIASHSFGAPVVAATLVVAGAIFHVRSRSAGYALVAFTLPLLLITTMVTKNGLQHGVWSMSSGVGQNVLQAYARSFKDPSGEERGVWLMAKREGYPDWWIWCYDEARRRDMHPNLNIPSWYGTCMFRRVNGEVVVDYSELKEYFSANNNKEMLAIVEKDMAIAENRPWLWSGPVYWRATGVSCAYGMISENVMTDLLMTRPDKFVRRFFSTLRRHWLYNSAVSYTLLNRLPFDEPGIVYAINLAIIPLFYLGNFVAIALFFRAIWRLAGKWRGRVPMVFRDSREEARTILAFAVLPVMALSALLACCENYRHALVFLPVLMVLALDALGRRDFWKSLQSFLAGIVAAGRRLKSRQE